MGSASRPASTDFTVEGRGERPYALGDLLAVMAALRTPATGCPWDLEQTFRTIAPYTIEEAYEVADAIERGDMADLEEELGDLLLQVVYHARMAEEAGAFAFADVADTVTRKMIRRHPHVFGTPEERAAGAEPGFWSRIKAAEKAEKAALRARLAASGGAADDADGAHAGPPASLLDDVPAAMPALVRAIKLQDKAAKVGFDWPSLAPVFDKMREELAELAEVALPHDPRGSTGAATRDAASQNSAITASPSPREDFGEPAASRAEIEEEFGDLLFVMANVARHLRIDPEASLRAANQKFTRRFHHIERRLAEMGQTPEKSTLAEMDALWDEAKDGERKGE
ncbi:MAG: nucleoside triphosphate pyrophosphohydrolase [Hyphomicrobiaceae bacterium]|nr:nucleoside triphosphate pyrophosphohydrolase [Hyphomicrobiaceae bacterium]